MGYFFFAALAGRSVSVPVEVALSPCGLPVMTVTRALMLCALASSARAADESRSVIVFVCPPLSVTEAVASVRIAAFGFALAPCPTAAMTALSVFTLTADTQLVCAAGQLSFSVKDPLELTVEAPRMLTAGAGGGGGGVLFVVVVGGGVLLVVVVGGGVTTGSASVVTVASWPSAVPLTVVATIV